MTTIDWHAKSLKEVAKVLNTDLKNGLSEEEHQKRLKKYGLNVIREEKKFRWLKLLWNQLKNPLIFILIIAILVTVILGKKTDALVILIAVAINATIGVFQESKANKAFEKLKLLVKKHSTAIRDGEEKEVDSETLVPGDIIAIKAGDGVGADARLIEAKNLLLNEAVLTGEWLPSEKQAGLIGAGKRITEQNNMIWAGTTVAEGWGKAAVVGTGMTTEFGKIVTTLKTEETAAPFQKGVKKLARVIGGIVIAASLIIFTAGIARGEEISQMFLTAVAISVAAIPEGLPVATTVILAIGMSKILNKGGLVRNLAAAETLGSTSVILTDKTGTLTKAEMRVFNIITAEEIIFSHPKSDSLELKILEIAILTSNAFIENNEAELKEWIIRGNPTERALLLAGIQAGLKPREIFEKYPRIDFLPFDAEKRFSASLNYAEIKFSRDSKPQTRISAAGAPEKIMEMCGFLEKNGKIIKLGAEARKKINNGYLQATKRGSRILALAYKNNPKGVFFENSKRDAFWNDLKNDFIFAGFIAFHDPLREDVKEAVIEAKNAGLRPIMITGDHRTTAISVAEQAGFFFQDGLQGKIMDGEKLEEISEKEFSEIVEEIDIYARVLPRQKMKIVEAWQKKGEVVAMTGDGVNDAPALKRADIGIALGSGTEVAKESSDLVLLNDSFSIIIAAIKQGRVIMDNLRKVVTFLLATGFTEIILISGALLTGLPLPILPAQILWANLVGEGFLNFAFAFEPEEKDVMWRNPRVHSSKKIITREMIWIIFGIGIITDIFLFILFLLFFNMNYPLERIRTIMFTGLTINSFFFVYAIKSLRQPLWRINILSNFYLIGASVISFLLLIAALTLAPLKNILSLTGITLVEFSVILGLGVLDLIAIEAAKFYFIKKEQIKSKII